MSFTTTAQEIIDDAEAILQDTGNTRWTAAEHLVAVNNGMKEICVYKPDAYVVTASTVMVAGIVQEIPAAGSKLLDIVCNMGVSPGTTQGNAIQLLDRKVMDAMDPAWPVVTAAATVIYYMYDPRYPRQFLVYPKQPSSGFGYVQLIYSATPAEIAVDATILISDIYRPALLQYVLYTAYTKDADHIKNAEKAIAYYRAFMNALGIMQDVEDKEDPNI